MIHFASLLLLSCGDKNYYDSDYRYDGNNAVPSYNNKSGYTQQYQYRQPSPPQMPPQYYPAPVQYQNPYPQQYGGTPYSPRVPYSRYYSNPYEIYPQNYDSDYYYRPPVQYQNVEKPFFNYGSSGDQKM